MIKLKAYTPVNEWSTGIILTNDPPTWLLDEVHWKYEGEFEFDDTFIEKFNEVKTSDTSYFLDFTHIS